MDNGARYLYLQLKYASNNQRDGRISIINRGLWLIKHIKAKHDSHLNIKSINRVT